MYVSCLLFLSQMIMSNRDSMNKLKRHLRGGCRCPITQNIGAERRIQLLDEFLQRESARSQANVEEEAAHDIEIEVQKLPCDLLIKIFILLPAESLFRSQFVCKKWFGLINTSGFIRSHSQHSETVLICKKLTLSQPANHAEFKPKSYFHFMDLDNENNKFIESGIVDLDDIRASYNGLILATTRERESLVLTNPITRNHIAFPLGTKCGSLAESYGIVFCEEAKKHKVVHLFHQIGLRIGCEILHICTRKWTTIEGPPTELLTSIRQIPVSVGGSLYWRSSKQECDHFISMNVSDEKFLSKKLPIQSCSRDRLVEIGGDLGFLSYTQVDLLQVWILIANGRSEENWMKKYSIDLSVFVVFPNVICCSRNGKRLVLEMKNDLYLYDFERGEMKLIQSTSNDDTSFQRIFDQYIPHQNTLASWEDHLEVPH